MLLCACIGFIGHLTNGFSGLSKVRDLQYKTERRIVPKYSDIENCNGTLSFSDICVTSKKPAVLLWGDSFAMHLLSLTASSKNVAIRHHTKNGCSPILDLSRISKVKPQKWAQSCILFNDSVYSWLQKNDSVEFVVLSSPFNWVFEDKSVSSEGNVFEIGSDEIINRFKKTVERIRRLGVGVVFVAPTPESEFNIGQCLVRKHSKLRSGSCDFDYRELRYVSDFVKKAEEFVPIYWISEDICSNGVCRSETQNIFYLLTQRI